jgi:predicted RNA binding protein YcfA (HicA-like mRNA interferase family)
LPWNNAEGQGTPPFPDVRQTGSHLILSHPERSLLVVPIHARDLPKGLFLKILKDAGFTQEDFYG